jgi:hypothetical protein
MELAEIALALSFTTTTTAPAILKRSSWSSISGSSKAPRSALESWWTPGSSCANADGDDEANPVTTPSSYRDKMLQHGAGSSTVGWERQATVTSLICN